MIRPDNVNQLISDAAALRISLETYVKHGTCDGSVYDLALSLVDTAKVLVQGDRQSPTGMLWCYTGMDAAKFLLESFYPLLHEKGLLADVYALHPNPTLLSKACRSYMWAMNQDHLDDDRFELSLFALKLGGFSTIKDLQESFRDFKVENAPSVEMCRMLLENTFAHIELFSSDPHYKHHGGKYFTVLLGKLIDEGDVAWALSFIEKNIKVLEEYSPIPYRRLDEPADFPFKARFLVHIQNYLRCDLLLSKLAELDEPAFNQVLSSPETHDHIISAIRDRRSFELSAIPLDPAMCRHLVTSALDHSLVSHEINEQPLRLLDFVRLEEACLTSGLATNGFMQILRKRPYFKDALKRTEKLILELVEAGTDANKIDVLGRQYAGKSMDTVILAAYASPALRKGLLDNLEPLSCLMALREHDSHVMLDLERNHVTALELKTIISASNGKYSALCDEWVDRGILKAPASIKEIAKLTQDELKKFRKLAYEHFSENELRAISWQDHRIRDSFFGQDLGL